MTMPSEPYVVFLRRIWTHRFADEALPWPRLLALMWLIQYAQFAERTKRFGGHSIAVPTGHFVASVRRLARQFRWSNPKVMRFLDELVRDETVCTVRVTPAGTLYRFVNWELYQPGASAIVTSDVHSNVNADVHSDGTRRSNDKEKVRTSIVRSEAATADTPTSNPALLGFARCWALYPRRKGGNSKADAERAYLARVRAGVDEQHLFTRTEAYRRFCDAMGKSGTEFVLMAKTFYGPSRRYDDDFSPTASDDVAVIPGARDADDSRRLKAAGF